MEGKSHLSKLVVAANLKEKERNYWLNKFAGDWVKTSFTVDYNRERKEEKSRETVECTLDQQLSADLKKLAGGSDVRLYIILVAGLTLLLYKYTGHQDIIMGTPVLRPDVEKEFINRVLALKSRVYADVSFKEFLLQIRQTIVEAAENRNFPIEVLALQLGLDLSCGDFPLFDVALLLENIHDKHYLDNLKLNMIFSFSRSAEDMVCRLEYNPFLYDNETAVRIMSHFRQLLRVVLGNVDIKISAVDILSAIEKNQILYDFNDTEILYAKDKRIHELIEMQAARAPDYIILTGWHSGTSRRVSLTYKQFNRDKDNLAGILMKKGVTANTLVGIILKRSIEMVTAMAAILKAGGAYLPISPDFPEDRKSYMLRDSGAKFLVTDRNLNEKAGKLTGLNIETVFIEDSGSRQEVIGSRVGAQDSGNLHAAPVPGTSLAYLIYTSGTTGKPKGVLVKHSSVVNVVTWFAKEYIRLPGFKILLMSDYTFDASVNQVFASLLFGTELHIIPRDLLLDIPALRLYIDKHKINLLNFVPSLLKELLCEKEKLASVNVVISGAERLEQTTKNKILEKGYCLYNHYGPTEVTIDALYLKCATGLVNLGKPVANTDCYILDKFGSLLPIGVTGELYVAGAGVAEGYLNRPELTAEKFVQNPFSYSPALNSLSHTLLYRTGDLVKWRPDGSIDFLGRVDEQVKIRGFRVEPGEIENQLLKHGNVKMAAVIPGEDEGGETYLCAYVVFREKNGGAAILKEYLALTLPDYMIPGYFVKLETMPLTPGGKLDRKALPKPVIGHIGREVAASPDSMEERIARLWSELLRIDPERISKHDNFFELGGHSLKAVQLVNKIHKEFAVDIELKEIFTNPTIQGLALRVKNSGGKEYIEIASREKKEYYDLSYGQRRLWVLNQLAEESSAYNMSLTKTVSGEFQATAFKKAVQTLMGNYEGLRTGFRIIENAPVQFIVEDIHSSIRELDLSSLSQEERSEKRNRVYEEVVKTSFDLSKPPLFRVVLAKLAESNYEWLFCMHHIITDGWSMDILERNFSRLYEAFSKGEGVNPDPLRIQYKDFAAWHNLRIENREGKQESHLFWKERLAGGFTPVELPVDFPGYEDNTQGAGYRCRLDDDAKIRLKKIAIQNNTTLFVVMFSVYILMLFRFSKQENISCSIIGAGRSHITFYDVIGFFVNSIFFKIEVDEQEHFFEFLSRVHVEVMECFEHQAYPLELVCNELKIKHPDLPVSFNMLNIQADDIKQELEYIQPHHVEDVQDVKFVIELYVMEYDNGIDLNWRYMKRAFEPETIAYIIGEYLNMIEFFSINREKSYTDFCGRNQKRFFKREKKES